MAKLKGIIKLEGTLDNLTFYKAQEGYLVKTKGGVSKERIQNDPAFERTRENGSEFGSSASSGKLLRTSVRNLMIRAKDNRVASRVTQVMTQIKNVDTTSIRGERNVATGLATPEGKAILKGLDFNNRAILSAVFFAPFSVDTATGEITIPNFTPANDISYPSGATHVSLSCAFLNLDFDSTDSAIEYSPIVNLPIDATSATQTLVPAGVPSGSGNEIFLLLVEFFQEINGVQYVLKNGAYNVLNIVQVA
ncbi:hypothetical protein C1T31_09825 [Hanstruepera neustonica]|uniref:Uncharacterized protein n=1 Tax=Hanstruepera neustonica TaxID=1445657 RepID=A0A2K1DXN5_9FLAO|nr:hypothetical protein [Hanstruepera neustonica]PNQ72799.1 hypothetical protein C1T31_09825 [Hanstruepera neustonica]